MDVCLRDLVDADLDQVFGWEQDRGAIAVAAFTRADPADRDAFDRHYAGIRANPETTVLAIEDAGVFVGTIGSYPMHGEREVTYWIDPARWGRGIASSALTAFLAIEVVRPLFAHVAAHNIGSATVLERAGFLPTGAETAYAGGLGRDVVEHGYRLDL